MDRTQGIGWRWRLDIRIEWSGILIVTYTSIIVVRILHIRNAIAIAVLDRRRDIRVTVITRRLDRWKERSGGWIACLLRLVAASIIPTRSLARRKELGMWSLANALPAIRCGKTG